MKAIQQFIKEQMVCELSSIKLSRAAKETSSVERRNAFIKHGENFKSKDYTTPQDETINNIYDKNPWLATVLSNCFDEWGNGNVSQDYKEGIFTLEAWQGNDIWCVIKINNDYKFIEGVIYWDDDDDSLPIVSFNDKKSFYMKNGISNRRVITRIIRILKEFDIKDVSRDAFLK